MPRHIPQPDPTAGLAPGRPGSSSAYWASISAKNERDHAATILDPHNKRSRLSLFFNPDEETEASIIQAFNNPRASLSTIAYDHHTTVEGLSAWMARPDIAIRIHNLRSASAVHLSLGATFDLVHVRHALAVILQEFTDAACHAAGIAEGRGGSPDEHNRRDRETARKACALMMRLANFHLTLRPPSTSRDPLRTPHSLNAPSDTPSDVTVDVPRAVAVPPQHPVRPAHTTRPEPDPTNLPELSDPELIAQIQQVLAHLNPASVEPHARAQAQAAEAAKLAKTVETGETVETAKPAEPANKESAESVESAESGESVDSVRPQETSNTDAPATHQSPPTQSSEISNLKSEIPSPPTTQSPPTPTPQPPRPPSEISNLKSEISPPPTPSG